MNFLNIIIPCSYGGREDFNYSSILIQDIMARTSITVNLPTAALQVIKMMEQG